MKKGETPAAPAEPAVQAHGDDLRGLLDRLERWLGQHRPRFLAGLRPGANEAKLHQLAAQLKLPVP